MKIQFYDFPNLHNADFQRQVHERFSKIISNNAFVSGEYNQKFEAEFAQMQKAKHCLLVANGTDALEMSLQAYGIGHGDLVGIPSISFYATAEVVINRGATPVFIDVDPQTGLMDPENLTEVLKEQDLKAIIPVHIYGMPAPMDELNKIAKTHKLKVIEDGAQGQGGFYEPNSPIGGTDNLVTFSFYPTKNLAAFGDAGAITTNDSKLIDDLTSIGNHGRSPEGHRLIGRNSRCDHLQAAVLHLKLETIEELNQNRKKVAKDYYQALPKNLDLLPEKYLELSSWHLFPVRTKSKEEKYELRDYLASKEIDSALFYEKSLGEELPLKEFAGNRERGIDFAAKTLCLPLTPFMNREVVEVVSKEIENFYK